MNIWANKTLLQDFGTYPKFSQAFGRLDDHKALRTEILRFMRARRLFWLAEHFLTEMLRWPAEKAERQLWTGLRWWWTCKGGRDPLPATHFIWDRVVALGERLRRGLPGGSRTYSGKYCHNLHPGKVIRENRGNIHLHVLKSDNSILSPPSPERNCHYIYLFYFVRI